MAKKVSIKDIAKKAGVSIAAVSYVMNGLEKEKRVGEEVARKIRETATQLNYRPNHAAKSLKFGSTKTIGLIVADISNSFFGDMARAIEEEAFKKGYTVIFGSSDEDYSKSSVLVHTLMSRQVDGMIITPVEGGDDKIKELSSMIPLVSVDRYVEDANSNYVILDNYAATYDAVAQLSKSGFKRTGIVGYDSQMIHIKERLRGYEEAMREFQPDSEILTGKVRYQNVDQDVDKILNGLLKQGQGIDSIIFATNTLTVSGLYFFQKNQIKIPEDIAVIGFDGNVAFDFFYSPLTYIKQPVHEMGKKAVEILIDKINGSIEHEQVKLKHKLIIRDSSQ